MNLYELSAEYDRLYELLDELESEQEIDEVIEQCDSLEQDMKQKCVNLGLVIKHLAAAPRGGISRIAEMPLSCPPENPATVRRCGTFVARMNENNRSVRRSQPLQPSKGVKGSTSPDNRHRLGVGYLGAEITRALGAQALRWLDKKAIKAAIQSGEQVPGCELVRTKSVVIR